MCFIVLEMSFEEKRSRRKKQGSAAEGDVRLPKVAEFCCPRTPCLAAECGGVEGASLTAESG